MSEVAFFNGRDGSLAFVASDSVVDCWFTVGLSGVLSGTVKVEASETSRGFLESLEENSHFVKVGLDDRLYGGVVESSQRDGNVFTVGFTGADGWWGKMDSVASNMASGGKSPREANEGVKIFYSDSARGVLYEVFKNQAEVMSARGWDSSVVDYSGLAGNVWVSGSEWLRSYRLNSFETPVFSSVVHSVVGELGSEEFFTVGVSEPLEAPFRFIVSVVEDDPMNVNYLGEYWSEVFDVALDYSGVERRALGVAAGTDLAGEQELVVTSQGADLEGYAFSSAIASSASEASNAISSIAYSEKARVNASLGSLSFSVFVGGESPLDVLDRVEFEVDFDRDGNVTVFSGVVVEKRVEGNVVTYSLDLTGSSMVRSAPSVERSLIFDPLNRATSLSFQNARRADNSTGWRN